MTRSFHLHQGLPLGLEAGLEIDNLDLVVGQHHENSTLLLETLEVD